MYKGTPLTCRDVASQLTDGFLKQSFLDCCNVTQQEKDKEVFPSIQNDGRCPKGFEFNAQGILIKNR